RKCFRHDLIVYQRYTMSSVIASPAKINRQLSQAPRHSRARDSSGDFAPPISFFVCMLAVIGFAVSRTWGPIWVPGSAGRAPTPTPRSVRCGLATRDSQLWLMRIAVQFLFQTIYSAFECAEFCLLGPQLLIGFHFGGLPLLFFTRQIFKFCLESGNLVLDCFPVCW